MQVDHFKPKLKAPGIKRLKLYYDELPSNFVFKFNLCRYTEVLTDVIHIADKTLTYYPMGFRDFQILKPEIVSALPNPDKAITKVGRCRFTRSNPR